MVSSLIRLCSVESGAAGRLHERHAAVLAAHIGDCDVDIVKAEQVFAVHALSRVSGDKHAAFPVEHHDLVVGPQRVFGMVGGDQEGHSAGAQVTQQAEQFYLVAEIKAVLRLIHDTERGLLGKGAGDQHHLALSAAEFREGTLREVEQVHLAQGLFRRFPIGVAVGLEAAFIGDPAHQDHLHDRESDIGVMELRDVGKMSGALPVSGPGDVESGG